MAKLSKGHFLTEFAHMMRAVSGFDGNTFKHTPEQALQSSSLKDYPELVAWVNYAQADVGDSEPIRLLANLEIGWEHYQKLPER